MLGEIVFDLKMAHVSFSALPFKMMRVLPAEMLRGRGWLAGTLKMQVSLSDSEVAF
jgi:hypothetical protein